MKKLLLFIYVINVCSLKAMEGQKIEPRARYFDATPVLLYMLPILKHLENLGDLGDTVSVDVIGNLINQGASVNKPNESGKTAVMYAEEIKNKFPKTFKFIKAAEAVENFVDQNKDDFIALHTLNDEIKDALRILREYKKFSK